MDIVRKIEQLEVSDYEKVDQVPEVQNEEKNKILSKSEKEVVQEEWNQNNYKEKNETRKHNTKPKREYT
ncbi:5114_t:CDS:1, partial [Gigaspora margarita]